MGWNLAFLFAQAAASPATTPSGESASPDAASQFTINMAVAIGSIVVSAILGPLLANRFRMQNYGWKIGLVIFSIVAGVAIVARGTPKLGIDLSGGSILVYEIDQTKKDPNKPVEMDKLISAVAKRVNPSGAKEITIRRYGQEQIEVIIPAVDKDEVDRIARQISNIGSLEFRIVCNRSFRDHADLIDRARRFPNSPEVRSSDGKDVLARWVEVANKPKVLDEFRRPEFETRTNSQKRLEVLVKMDKYNVTGANLTRAASGIADANPCVDFSFDSSGAARFGALTGSNLPDPVTKLEKQLAIILNGQVQSAPNIKSTITSQGQITGHFSQEEVDDLVGTLIAGSLPTALYDQPSTRMEIGATLGADTINDGKIATIAGMCVVVLFMVLYYRFAGVVASIALAINLIWTIGLMILIKAAFTLTGIAGLALTLGMAVDANVLIYERIREELAKNATLRMAIRNGFARAMTTIIDSNLTTLITGIVLFVVGTDQIKGFAITLCLGLVASLFTAIFVSRVILDICERMKWISTLRMMQFVGATNFDFMGKWRLCAGISAALILIGFASIAARGRNMLDIDFLGGTQVQVLFAAEGHTVYELQEKLQELPDLSVSIATVTGEPLGKRFLVSTSKLEVKEVESLINKQFGNALARNNVTVEQVAIGAPAALPAATPEKPANAPATGAGAAAPHPAQEILIASTSSDAGLEFLTSQEASPTTPSQEPQADPPKSTTPVNPNEAARQDETGKPSNPAQPADAADKAPAGQPTATDPASTPGSTSTAPPTGGTTDGANPQAASSRFLLKLSVPLNHDTMAERINAALTARERATQFQLFNAGYQSGSSKPFDSWEVEMALPADVAKPLFDEVATAINAEPVFPASTNIGGKVAGDMRTTAITALLASLVLIVAYIWVRFEKVVFGLAAVIALVHDVCITLGALGISYYLAKAGFGVILINPFKIDLTIVAAILTIIGYSLNDTIVVFDRIREVRGKSQGITVEMLNLSINQTLSRTILTGLTTMFVVLILYFIGGQGVHGFAYCLFVGMIVGTFSSVYVASPILLWLMKPSQPNELRRNAAA